MSTYIRTKKKKTEIRCPTESRFGNNWLGGVTRLARTGLVHRSNAELVLDAFFQAVDGRLGAIASNLLARNPVVTEFLLF